MYISKQWKFVTGENFIEITRSETRDENVIQVDDERQPLVEEQEVLRSSVVGQVNDEEQMVHLSSDIDTVNNEEQQHHEEQEVLLSSDIGKWKTHSSER